MTAHLHIVDTAPPPRPRRIAVRINASSGRAPLGRSRLFRLLEIDLDELLRAAELLEARR